MLVLVGEELIFFPMSVTGLFSICAKHNVDNEEIFLLFAE